MRVRLSSSQMVTSTFEDERQRFARTRAFNRTLHYVRSIETAKAETAWRKKFRLICEGLR